MQFHYALVDDLLPKDEFERRVEDKIKECGDLVDELTAAMLVVRDLGREHVKIRDLAGRSSLFSFFGKVIGKNEPREFDRADGEKGLVAALTVGDETGETRVVLWDEKAFAAGEIETGDVLEIIGKHGKRQGDIVVLALRKASIEIECRNGTGLSRSPAKAERVNLDVCLLATGETRTFTRRDGTTGEMTSAVVGDETGTARLVCWVPGLLEGFEPGMILHIEGAADRSRQPVREFSIDDKSTIGIETGRPIRVPVSEIGSVRDEGIYSVKGRIVHVMPWRPFATRDGSRSLVRNIMIEDGTGRIRVVIWGDPAGKQFFPGDMISVFNATSRRGRTGEMELGIGRDSAFLVDPGSPGGPVDFRGTILSGRDGTFLDNGTTVYILEGEHSHGIEVRVKGTCAGHTITPVSIEPVELDPDPVRKRCRRLLDDSL